MSHSILIALADRDLADRLQEVLGHAGWCVQTARDTATALTSFLFARPAIACLDEQLSDGEGRRLIEQIIDESLRPNVPIIALTSFATRSPRLRTIAASEDAFEELLERIDQVAPMRPESVAV